MATALVIGGSGQIGRAVVPALLGDGWDVRVLARHARTSAARSSCWATGRTPTRSTGRSPAAWTSWSTSSRTTTGRPPPLIERADRIGSAVVVSSAAVYVDDAGDGFESEEFGSFPVPVTEDQPTVGPGPRHLRDRQGGARAGVVGVARAHHDPAAGRHPRPRVRPAARVDVREAGARRPRRARARLRRAQQVPHDRDRGPGRAGAAGGAAAGGPGAERRRPARRSPSPRSPRRSTRPWASRRAWSPSRATRWTASG